jgi:hypothetical protein
MYLKIHRTPDGNEVVAACDRELLNTRIEYGDIDICISEKFYGNCPATPEEVCSALERAENANLMGPRVVTLAISRGFIDKSGCIMLGTIPHAQIIRL